MSEPIRVVHPLAGLLRERAVLGRSDPRPLLGITQIFGEVGDDPRLAAHVEHWLGLLYEQGAKATLSEARRLLAF